MRFLRTWLLSAVALFAFAAAATAQTTNGTISGHVVDDQGLALPGVTVNASSPNMQGVRTVISSENGDYILTAFMGFTVPTGDDGNSNGHTIYTPTIAFGKGLGNFDFQSTVGVEIPNGGMDRLSMPLRWNTALQYRVFRYFWPELEFNYSWFTLG